MQYVPVTCGNLIDEKKRKTSRLIAQENNPMMDLLFCDVSFFRRVCDIPSVLHHARTATPFSVT